MEAGSLEEYLPAWLEDFTVVFPCSWGQADIIIDYRPTERHCSRVDRGTELLFQVKC